MDKGYEQAVQNLAWKIIEFSERDFDHMAEVFAGRVDLMLEYLDEHPEKKQDWDKLEEITEVVCETYGVEYEQLASDVWNQMIQFEVSQPKYWN